MERLLGDLKTTPQNFSGRQLRPRWKAEKVWSEPLAVSIYFVIYYFLSNGSVLARRVLPAAIIAAVLTEAGKLVYALTLPVFRFREVYGPFTLSVTLLFWGFLGALILLFSAHLSARDFWDLSSAEASQGGARAGVWKELG
jgi:hypothetical protein